MIDNFVEWVRKIDRRLQTLEQSTGIKDITIPDDGKIIIPSYASDPLAGVSTAGQMYFNTTTNKFKGFDGTNWQALH